MQYCVLEELLMAIYIARLGTSAITTAQARTLVHRMISRSLEGDT